MAAERPLVLKLVAGAVGVLAARGRRLLRVHLGADVAGGLEVLKGLVEQALV